MMLRKTTKLKEEAPAATPEPSLKDQLKQAVDAAEKYIATVAQREKDASPLQPLSWHELNLRLQYGRDSVRCALALLEKEQSNG
jgi:hypothetical protein